MYIIGITGPIGHGKTTFANLLSSVEPKSEQVESGLLISEVANAWFEVTESFPAQKELTTINAWVAQLAPVVTRLLQTTCTPEQLAIKQEDLDNHPEYFAKLFTFIDMVQADPTLTETYIAAAEKERFRPILQWLGSFLAHRVGAGIWYDEIVRRINTSRSDTILYVVSGLRYPADGEIIRQAGGTVVKIARPQVAERDAQDPTERERSKIAADVEVINDGSVEDLLKVAEALYRGLVNGTLQATYQATTTAVN